MQPTQLWRRPGPQPPPAPLALAAPEPGQQALLALAHLRNGDPFTRLAAGFGVGTATAWRYVREVITLLSTAADELATAMTRIRRPAYAILDGTLVPIGSCWYWRLLVREAAGRYRRGGWYADPPRRGRHRSSAIRTALAIAA